MHTKNRHTNVKHAKRAGVLVLVIVHGRNLQISITISSCIADISPRNNISLQIGYQNSSPIVARSKSLIHFDCALHRILLLLISPTVSAMVGASIHGLAEESVTSRKQLNLSAPRTHQPLLVTPDSS